MEDMRGFNLDMTSANNTIPTQCQCQCMFSQSSSDEKSSSNKSPKRKRKMKNNNSKFKKFKIDEGKKKWTKDKKDDCYENVLSFFCVCCE